MINQSADVEISPQFRKEDDEMDLRRCRLIRYTAFSASFIYGRLLVTIMIIQFT